MIGLLHPGQMGAAIGAQLTGAGHEVLWCRAGRGARTAHRAADAGLRGVDTLAELLACPVLISVCPPAAAEDVAREVAEAGFAGVYVDANAISPHRMIRIGGLFETVVDGSIIGPPPNADRDARLYLSGPDAAVDLVSELFTDSAAKAISLGPRIGDASALKMAYGSYNKASHALAAVSHALAERHGVGAALRAEAAEDSGGALGKLNRLPSVAARAWRWGPELREAAESFAAAGLPPDLASAAAEVFRRWDADKDDTNLDVAEALRHLHADD
jgi:3-hydroxyisobutyrate dehydrogenase-like beta-hydroxyacid dehydrogenase